MKQPSKIVSRIVEKDSIKQPLFTLLKSLAAYSGYEDQIFLEEIQGVKPRLSLTAEGAKSF